MTARIKRILARVCCALTLVNVVGCAQQQQKSAAEVESVPAAEQQASATRFVEAFFRQDVDALQNSVGLPFFYNRQAILAYPAEWQAVLDQLRTQTQPTENFSVLSVEPMLPGQILADKPRLWATFLEYKFDGNRYFLYTVRQPLSAEAQKNDPQGRRYIDGKILLIVDPQTAKVRGFVL